MENLRDFLITLSLSLYGASMIPSTGFADGEHMAEYPIGILGLVIGVVSSLIGALCVLLGTLVVIRQTRLTSPGNSNVTLSFSKHREIELKGFRQGALIMLIGVGLLVASFYLMPTELA